MSISEPTLISKDLIIEVKSKFDAEFRRFSINRATLCHFAELCDLLKKLHGLAHIVFVVQYTDREDDLLPITNDKNFTRALQVTRGLLRLLIQRKGESRGANYGYGRSAAVGGRHVRNGSSNGILDPRRIVLLDDFRRVSSIIDVDIVPDAHRRVKLVKSDSMPLGFYIRDGTSMRVTPIGIEKISGIFVSRLLPGGLAESTGLLAVDDEVIEVNGIEVGGKTLDQVTDMMVVNSTNLIITVKPANQSTCSPRRDGSNRPTSSCDSNRKSCLNGEMSSHEYLHHNQQLSRRLDETMTF